VHKDKINSLEKNGETVYIIYQKRDYEKQVSVTVQEGEAIALATLKVTEKKHA
jgi:hypothetical protein